MVSILLLILKILLIIIGTVLAIAIFMIALVLFVPIHYEAVGSKDEAILVEAKVNWLFRIIRLSFTYKNELHYNVKVFWITLFSSLPIQSGIKKNKKKKSSKVNVKSDSSLNQDINISKHEQSIVYEPKTQKDSIENNLDESSKIARQKQKKIKAKKPSKKKKFKEEEDDSNNLFQKIRDFLTEDAYKGVVKFVIKHSWKIIKSLLPRRIRLHLEFGTNDPAVTGYILGILSIFYAVTGNSMVIEPDFDRKLLKGSFNIKGRIFIFIIVYHALKIVLDKRVKKLIAEYNH